MDILCSLWYEDLFPCIYLKMTAFGSRENFSGILWTSHIQSIWVAHDLMSIFEWATPKSRANELTWKSCPFLVQLSKATLGKQHSFACCSGQTRNVTSFSSAVECEWQDSSKIRMLCWPFPSRQISLHSRPLFLTFLPFIHPHWDNTESLAILHYIFPIIHSTPSPIFPISNLPGY